MRKGRRADRGDRHQRKIRRDLRKRFPGDKPRLSGKSGEEDGKLPPDLFVETLPGSIKEPEGLLSKALWWLKTHQEQDGSWNDGPCPAAAGSDS